MVEAAMMTEAQLQAIWRKPPPAEDRRPWWRRLVSSVRVTVTAGKSWRKPVKSVGIKGGCEW
jgi:hypothetical protein